MIDLKTIVMFNASSVVNAVDRVTRKTLSKAGAFVRQTAKRSIRNRKSAAPAGSPPSSHEGSLKRLIVFGFDPQREEVVVGPMRFAEQHRELRQLALQQGDSDSADNPVLDGMVRKIQEATAEAERLAAVADLADMIARGNEQMETQRQLMSELADLHRKVFDFGASKQASAILAVQSRAEALRDEFSELGQLTDAVAQNIDRLAQKNIDDIIQQPIRDLQDEVVELRISAGGPGLQTDLSTLQAEWARAVRDAQTEGISDPTYFNLLREKYGLLAEQLQKDAAQAIADASADLSFEIAELEIENSLDDLEEKLALLQHRLKRDLAEAVEQGLDPELVKRKYALMAEAARLDFEPELPDVNVGSTFNGRLAGQILGGGSAVDRIATATEQTARNTDRLARGRGAGANFT